MRRVLIPVMTSGPDDLLEELLAEALALYAEADYAAASAVPRFSTEALRARAVLEEAMPLAQGLAAKGTWPPPSVHLAEVQETLGNVLVRERDPNAEALLRDSITARRRAVEDYRRTSSFASASPEPCTTSHAPSTRTTPARKPLSSSLKKPARCSRKCSAVCRATRLRRTFLASTST